ncbi:MAG: MerR family transcriptional regulator [Sulfuricaulis sp.]
MTAVSQLSKRSGIAPHAGQCTKYGVAQTLSPWNPILPPIAHARRYHASALHLYHQDSRFTFENIRHLVGLSEAGESPCQEVREIMRRRVEKNRRRIVDQIALQRRMEQALACREEVPHVPPCDGTAGRLIESAARTRVED